MSDLDLFLAGATMAGLIGVVGLMCIAVSKIIDACADKLFQKLGDDDDDMPPGAPA